MKKLGLSIILGLSLLACKKEDHKMTRSPEKDSLVVEKTADSAMVEHKALQELTPKQIGLDLKNKANDTLYITNFFATWCGPCMKEIPHFKEKMHELEGQPVKFTFVSLDNKTDWETGVSDFADEYDIRKNVILLDGTLLGADFFKENFKSWSGEAIPFTMMKKGNISDEYMGMMTKELLADKVTKMLGATSNTAEIKEKSKIAGPSNMAK